MTAGETVMERDIETIEIALCKKAKVMALVRAYAAHIATSLISERDEHIRDAEHKAELTLERIATLLETL